MEVDIIFMGVSVFRSEVPHRPTLTPQTLPLTKYCFIHSNPRPVSKPSVNRMHGHPPPLTLP